MELIAHAYDQKDREWTLFSNVNNKHQCLDFHSAQITITKGKKTRVLETIDRKLVEKYLKCDLDDLHWEWLEL